MLQLHDLNEYQQVRAISLQRSPIFAKKWILLVKNQKRSEGRKGVSLILFFKHLTVVSVFMVL